MRQIKWPAASCPWGCKYRHTAFIQYTVKPTLDFSVCYHTSQFEPQRIDKPEPLPFSTRLLESLNKVQQVEHPIITPSCSYFSDINSSKNHLNPFSTAEVVRLLEYILIPVLYKCTCTHTTYTRHELEHNHSKPNSIYSISK